MGVKKCEPNQNKHASRQVQPKVLISGEAMLPVCWNNFGNNRKSKELECSNNRLNLNYAYTINKLSLL